VGGDEAERELDEGEAGGVGDLGQALDGVEPGLVGRQGEVEAGGHERGPVGADVASCADGAGEPAGGQRAPGQDAESVLLGDRQDVGLDAALEDRVAGLLGDVATERVLAGGPLRLHDAVGRVGRGAEVADLAGALQVGQRASVSSSLVAGSQRWTW
jgi:hypothetical protein